MLHRFPRAALLAVFGPALLLLGQAVYDPLADRDAFPGGADVAQLAARAPAGVPLAPVMDLPEALRTANWGGGSCVHASTVHLLEWQGLPEWADWWRRTYRGGEYADRLHRRLETAGLRYAYTTRGDVEFLEWALRTRRGAGITFWTNHAVNLVHLDEERAGLLDNNRIHEIIWIPRREFVRRWRGYGGWAWTLVYDPPPPQPYLAGRR